MRLDIGTSGSYPARTSLFYPFVVRETRATALHEFGHALGLLHEHERLDAPDCEQSDGSRIIEDEEHTYVTPYDSDSIMNYCRTPGFTGISKSDRLGLQRLYPEVSLGH